MHSRQNQAAVGPAIALVQQHRASTPGWYALQSGNIVHIEKTVAFHMDKLRRCFARSELDENLIENVDGTHLIVNTDNDRILGFRGDGQVR